MNTSSSPAQWLGDETVEMTSDSAAWVFESVYRSEYPGLVAVAAALTGDRDGAYDLV